MFQFFLWLGVLAFDTALMFIGGPDPVNGGCVGFALAAFLYVGIPDYLRQKRRRERNRRFLRAYHGYSGE